MPTISSPGIGSGLDINGIVDKLMAAERRPIDVLDRKKSSYDTQLSAYGKLSSALADLCLPQRPRKVLQSGHPALTLLHWPATTSFSPLPLRQRRLQSGPAQ